MYCMVITTCSEKDEGKIKKTLLKEGLAACISSFDVASSYTWKGEIERAREKMLFIKTKKEKYKELERKIIELHSHELPEIICIEMSGYNKYLKWIDSVIK